MAKQRVTCARCSRERYADRMRSVPGRIAAEAPIWLCQATGTCRIKARQARKQVRTAT